MIYSEYKSSFKSSTTLVVSIALFVYQKCRQSRDCYIILQTRKLKQRLGVVAFAYTCRI